MIEDSSTSNYKRSSLCGIQAILLCRRCCQHTIVLELPLCKGYPVFCILCIACAIIRGMDKLHYYVRQTDGLKPAMKNVVKLWEDPHMSHMELFALKLSKADEELLKHDLTFHCMTIVFLTSNISLSTHNLIAKRKLITLWLRRSLLPKKWI